MDKSDVLRALDFHAYYSAELNQSLKVRADGWTENISCPFHEDKAPSFGVNVSTGASKCFGCDFEGDIFSFHMKRHGADFLTALMDLGRRAGLEPDERRQSSGKPFIHPQLGEPVEKYPYKDESGKALFYACRFNPKNFRQCLPDGLTWHIKGVRQVPYHLPRLMASSGPVLILEGEKDVHAAEAHGFTATTNSGGAGNWTDEHSRFLIGREVIIISDCDKAGDDRTLKIIQSLHRVGVKHAR